MLAQVFYLLRIVVGVINFNLVPLRLFEVEVDKNLFDEFWVQIVVNHFRLAQLLPHVPLLLKHDNKGVRIRHCIHVGKLFAFKSDLKLVK